LKKKCVYLLVFTLVLNLMGVGTAYASSSITQRISVSSAIQGNSESDYPSISADGRYVAFASSASNLIVGDMNGLGDIFVYDRQTGETKRVSVSSTGV